MIRIITNRKYRNMVHEIERLEKVNSKQTNAFNELQAAYEKLHRIYQGLWEMRQSTADMMDSLKKTLQQKEHQLNEAKARLRKYEIKGRDRV